MATTPKSKETESDSGVISLTAAEREGDDQFLPPTSVSQHGAATTAVNSRVSEGVVKQVNEGNAPTSESVEGGQSLGEQVVSRTSPRETNGYPASPNPHGPRYASSATPLDENWGSEKIIEQLKGLNAGMAGLTATIDGLKEQIESEKLLHIAAIEKINEEMEQLKVRISKLETNKCKNESEIMRLTTELQSKEKEIKIHEAELKIRDEEIKRLKKGTG